MSVRQRPRADDGFTLIEIIVAMTLSLVLIGVMVSVLITSMNAASSTNDQAHDSTDLGTVSAFLYRDAQNVNVAVSTTGFQGCSATGTPVGSFKWTDKTVGGITSTYIAAYSLTAKANSTASTLTRTLCTNGTAASGTAVLGQSVVSSTLTCGTPSDCSTIPATVSMHIVGGGTRSPLDRVLTVSVRPSSESRLDKTASPTSLLVLADTAGCPSIDLQGNNAVTINGKAVVSSGCATPIKDPNSQLAPGSTLTSGVGDPLAGLVTTPTGTDCPNGGGNPTIASHTPDPTVTVYYPGFYSISSPTYFPPGRYFFCGGLEVKAGGSIEGSNLFISVRNTTNSGKGLFIDPGATVNALAQTSGQYKGILLWISGNQPLDLGLNGAVSNYGGLVYTPSSVVTLTAASSGTTPSMASNIAGLVAQQVKFTGSGTVLFGPTPTDISLSPTSLPNAKAGQSYAATITAPGIAEVRWSSVNLPAGLSVDNSGQISGTPTCSGIFSPELAAFDASGSAAGAAYDGHSSLFTGSPVTYSKFSIAPGATLTNPGTPVKKGVTLNAVATNCSASTKVAFQSAPTGTSTWTTICNNVSSLTAAFSCSWSPADGTYDLRVQATDAALTTTSPTVSGITVDGTAPTIGTITPAAAATMSGSQAVTAVVTDAGSGLASVTFGLSGGSGPATCTGVLGSSNTYSCNLATGSLTNGSYTLTVTATDNVGNVATKSQSNTVTNSGTCGIGTAPDVQACNGTGTVGKIETGDKIVLAYAAAMSKTSILSGWTTDPKNIFVRVRDNNNQETVDFWTSNEADSDKQVYLGSIDIGKGNANDFMNKDTTVWFNASMTMSSDGTTITITIGAFNSGTSSNLKTRSTTGTLVWTPDSHAKTTGNVAVSTKKVNESGAADIDF